MPFLQRDQRNIFYTIDRARASDSSETVVLLHTNITDHTLYNRLVPYLTEYYNVVRFDLSGLGHSDLGGDAISLDAYVADLRYVIQELGLAQVYLAGIGFGGFICCKYSSLYQDSVKKTVLFTLPCFPEESLPIVQQHRRAISQEGHVIPAENLIKKTTTLDERDREYKRLYTIIKRTDASVYTTLMHLTITGRTLDYVASNATPTLILAGDKEIIFPQDLLVRGISHLPHIRYSVVPNASSFLMVDQPEITARLMREFFRSEPPTGRFTDDVSYAIQENVRRHTQQTPDPAAASSDVLNRVQFDLLYSFKVWVNGKPVSSGWNQRYAKQILAYLLFHPTTTREALCEDLWPDTPLLTAKKNLRVYLGHLKNLLQTEAGESVLVLDREHVHLDGEVASDALRLIADVQWAVSATDEHKKLDRVLSIFSRLDSPKYLTAIDDNWFLQKRQKLEQDLTYLAAWAITWLATHGQSLSAQHLLSSALPVLEDSEALYELLSEHAPYALNATNND